MSDTYAPPASATVLAIETSTASLAAAVVRDGETLGSVQSFAERNHSVLIVPEIQALLKECGVSPDSLGAIAVGQGPGSYTGVRIAVSVGKTLAWAWGKTLLGVSSLEALALGAWRTYKENAGGSIAGPVWLVPVMDARRGQVYTARFLADASGRWERLDADGIRLAAEWAEQLRTEAAAGMGPAPAILAAGEIGPQLEAAFGAGNETGPAIRLVPHAMEAVSVAELAAERLRRGERDEIHAFVPNYTQLAEAEAKLLAARARGD
ncbi:tRNA (adenosine(37)-N6)-threonylcarbamoyltransferase complex dimerization subunit type 1 TsaB [Cohnella caldifontis]|uniref:tRNA (adenosine(37)-N6)-threonylcarbamoyltransferase complex dimerization subunit type 1 TsaB n=1 Tax=Cohnella caldifontis TaxID=3027471 RepID=UPI0023EBD993|nr:tRNA (adenosine(37)-N6)-threonylcarbamoyltransferase complex dimerization subunit type 1 TsaB [Cohnella sp. YIM B05605]